jgi:hypothetical protein
VQHPAGAQRLAAWWWIITLLLAVLGAFVVRTELWALFCRLLWQQKATEVKQLNRNT